MNRGLRRGLWRCAQRPCGHQTRKAEDRKRPTKLRAPARPSHATYIPHVRSGMFYVGVGPRYGGTFAIKKKSFVTRKSFGHPRKPDDPIPFPLSTGFRASHICSPGKQPSAERVYAEFAASAIRANFFWYFD